VTLIVWIRLTIAGQSAVGMVLMETQSVFEQSYLGSEQSRLGRHTHRRTEDSILSIMGAMIPPSRALHQAAAPVKHLGAGGTGHWPQSCEHRPEPSELRSVQPDQLSWDRTTGYAAVPGPHAGPVTGRALLTVGHIGDHYISWQPTARKPEAAGAGLALKWSSDEAADR
jgi:hypothetical protein